MYFQAILLLSIILICSDKWLQQRKTNSSIDRAYLEKGNDTMMKFYHPPIGAST